MVKFVDPSEVSDWVSTAEYLPRTEVKEDLVAVFVLDRKGHRFLCDTAGVAHDASTAKLISYWVPVSAAAKYLTGPSS